MYNNIFNNNPYNKYKEQSVMTASPGELTLMLYDGCLKQMRFAKIFIEEKKIQEKNEALQKAQRIISELMSTLDMDIELSNDLFKLYEYVFNELVQANIKNDIEKIDNAISLVKELRDSWEEAIKASRKVMYNEQG